MSDETVHSRLDRLADNTTAKLIRTYVVPAILAATLWLGGQVWTQVKANGEATVAGIENLKATVGDIKQTVAVQAAVFSDKAKQIDDNTADNKRQDQMISNHEARIQVLEADKGVRR